jgi:hypothetical protein
VPQCRHHAGGDAHANGREETLIRPFFSLHPIFHPLEHDHAFRSGRESINEDGGCFAPGNIHQRKNAMKVRTTLLLALAAGLFLGTQTRADDLGLDFTGGNPATAQNNQTLGWEFNLSTTRTVTALGMFDVGADGLNSGHLVGIWTTGGTLLGSVTVSNSSTPITSTSANGRWLFQSLGSPLTLAPGNYVLGVDYTDVTDQVITSTNAPSMASSLTFVQGRFTSNPTAAFDFPDATFPTSGGHFGPDALFAAVPEPASLALVGAGFLGVGYWFVRRRAGRQAERRIG